MNTLLADAITADSFPTVTSIFTTIGVIVAFVAVVIGLIFLRRIRYGVDRRKKLHFGLVVIIALALGVGFAEILKAIWGANIEAAVGINDALEIINIVPTLFINALLFMIVPLILVSIIRSLLNASGSGAKTAKAGGRILAFLLGTVAVSALIGYSMVRIFNLTLADFGELKPDNSTGTTLIGTIQSIIPSNMLGALAKNSALPIVFIALFIGIAMSAVKKDIPELGEKFVKVIEGLYEIAGTMIDMVIKFTPYAVFGMVTCSMATNSLSVLASLAKFVGAYYCGLILILLMQFLLAFLSGIGMKNYFKKASPAWIFAFAAMSSMAALPVTIQSLKDMDVEEGTASLAGSFGTCIGQNTWAGLHPAMCAAIAATGVASINPTSIGFIIQLVLFCVVGSVGAAGVGGGNIQASLMVFSMLGLDLGIVLFLYGVDFFISLSRPPLNQNGSIVAGIWAQKLENMSMRRKKRGDIPPTPDAA